MRRRLSLALLALLVVGLGAALLVLRTPWAGARLCDLAASRARVASGLEVSVGACRVDPFRLELQVKELRVGPLSSPLLTAAAARVRVATLPAPGRQLALAELSLQRPRIRLALPASDGSSTSTCPPPALRALPIRDLEITEGALDLAWPGGERLTVERLDVRAATPLLRRALSSLTRRAPSWTSLELSLSGARITRGSRTLTVDAARVLAGVARDLSRVELSLATAEVGGTTLAAAGTVDDLCHPTFDLALSGAADLPALAALAGWGSPVKGRAHADAQLTGTLADPRIAGELRLVAIDLDGWRVGDASIRLALQGREIRVEAMELPAEATRGRVTARGKLHLGPEPTLEAEADLHDYQLGELLSRLQLPGAWVMGRMTGKVSAKGTVSPLRLAGQASLDLADFRVLDHGWERWRFDERPVLELARAHLEGPVRVDRSAVRLDGVRLKVGRGQLTTRGALHFTEARGFELSVDGQADLARLRRVGGLELSGLATLTGVTVRAAPYGEPAVKGALDVEGLRLLTLDLGQAAAAVDYAPSVLRFHDVSGRKGLTRYGAEVAVDLRASPTRLAEGRFSIDGRLRDAFQAVEPWLPGAARVREVLEAPVTLRGTASGPVERLDASFEGELGAGTLFGHDFDGGRLAGEIEAAARVRFSRLELRRGEGRAEARGTIGFAPPFPWELAGKFDAVRLAELGLGGPSLGGEVGGAASLRGSAGRPVLTLEARSPALSVEGVSLGSADLGAVLDGTALDLTASADGIAVRGRATLAGQAPFEARAAVDVPDALRLLPGGRPLGLAARLRGEARLSGDLANLPRAAGELRLDTARITYGDFEVKEAAPVVLALEGGRLRVRALDLRGPNTRLALSGAVEAGGALALDARGALDLRLVGGVLPGVQEPRGQLGLEAHLGGTVREPRLVGTGRVRDASFTLRDLPVSVAGLGGPLTFSQNRVLFDGLQAAVNGGATTLSGELTLRRLSPARVRVAADLSEVPLRVPEWLPSTVTGRLQAVGSFEAMALSGKLHVVRALYAQPVDFERRLLEVPGRRPPPRPYDRAGEWVTLDIGLAVDGDARIDNDLVRAGVQGDLTLTGTLAGIGLLGNLRLKEGARASFRGNEFALRHGVLDFTDRRKIRMSLDVEGEAQVNDYQVALHLTGPWEDPALQLSSQPALSQRDLVTLLSLGYTTRDTTAAGGAGGAAAAAAAQALFSASGLDSQVRRFVPKGTLFRDFTVRITSGYSEASGQVEPRAEVESRLLDERFRLRYQAPLASARGQRAQAEMRLGPRTSLQYGWDNESTEVASGGDHGLDLKFRWEWND